MNLFQHFSVTLVLWFANQLVHSKITCPKDHYIVVKNGTESCLPCNSCPHGFGLSPPCGSKVDHPPPIDCVPCVSGKTYSDKYGPSACKNCQICSAKEIVTRNCTASDNTICSNTCEEGYYYENSTHNCQPCSDCCNKEYNITIKECKSMPLNKQCSIHSAQQCKPKTTAGIATPFYHTTTGTLSTSASKTLNTGVIIACVIGVAVGVISIIALILLYKRRKQSQRNHNIIGSAAYNHREDHDAEHQLLDPCEDDQCYLNQLELSVTNYTSDPLSEGKTISLKMNYAFQNGNNNRKCNFDFEWKKDGLSIPNNNYQKYSKDLVIENVVVADSGQYHCEIRCNKHRTYNHKQHDATAVKLFVKPREGTELKLFTDLDWSTQTKIQNWLKPKNVGTGNWMDLGIEYGIDEDDLKALDKEKAPCEVLESIKCNHPDLTVFDFCEKMKSNTMKQNRIAKFLKDQLTKPKEPKKSGIDGITRPDSGIDEESDSDVPLRVKLSPEPSKPSQLKIPALDNLGHADSSREASRESSTEDLNSVLNNVQNSDVPLGVKLSPEPSKPSQLKIPALDNLGRADSSREASRESSIEDLNSVLNNVQNSMKPMEDKGSKGVKRILRRKKSGGSQNISAKNDDFEDYKDEDEKSNRGKSTLYGRQTSKDSQKSDDIEFSGTRERKRSRSSSIASSIKEIVLKQPSVEYSALDHHHEESDEGV